MDNQLFWLGVVKLNPLARLPEFLLGMGFGAFYLRARRRTGTWPILAGAAMLVAVIALRTSIAYPILHTGLIAPAFGLIILGFAAQPAKGILASKPLVLLGEVSYSFYLLHVIPIMIMTFGLHISSASPHIGFIVIAYLLSVILVSIAVYYGIELPMRNLLRPRKQTLPPIDQNPRVGIAAV
jgi:peptidoglycan/LPS O-acetylase OafA/YrhL